LVLLSLADRANEEDVAWPQVKRLTLDTGLHRETVMNATAALQAKGVIEITKFGRRNKYRLLGVVSRHAERSEKADRSEKPDLKESENPNPKESEKPNSNNLPPESPNQPPTPLKGGGIISSEAWNKASAQWPGHDIDLCLIAWKEWSDERTKKEGQSVKNHDAAFLAWMKTPAKDDLSHDTVYIPEFDEATLNTALTLIGVEAVAIWRIRPQEKTMLLVVDSENTLSSISSLGLFTDHHGSKIAALFGMKYVRILVDFRLFVHLVRAGRTGKGEP